MAQNDTADLVFERWQAALKNKDRSRKNVPNNFDELFSDLKRADIPFKDAHDLLSRAVKAHLPNKSVVRHTWNGTKALHNIFANENEFAAEWNESIKNSATDMFFSNYPLKIDDDDDGEPKVYGNMSVKEYRLQRRYADAFPTLNTDDLIRQMKERQTLQSDLSNVLGGENDDN